MNLLVRVTEIKERGQHSDYGDTRFVTNERLFSEPISQSQGKQKAALESHPCRMDYLLYLKVSRITGEKLCRT